MAFSDLKIAFEDKEKEYGCKYAAVNAIAMKAREKLQSTEHRCSVSDAIRWATTGEEPEITVNPVAARKIWDSPYHDVVDRVLDDVDDESIRSAVLASVADSQCENHLIYNYTGVEDERKKSRVRVLTRMIFYSTYPNE